MLRLLFAATVLVVGLSSAADYCNANWCATVRGGEAWTLAKRMKVYQITTQPGQVYLPQITDAASMCTQMGLRSAVLYSASERNALATVMAGAALTGVTAALHMIQGGSGADIGGWYYRATSEMFLNRQGSNTWAYYTANGCRTYCPDLANYQAVPAASGHRLVITSGGVSYTDMNTQVGYMVCELDSCPGCWNDAPYVAQSGTEGSVYSMYYGPLDGIESSYQLAKQFCTTRGQTLASIRTSDQLAAVMSLSPPRNYYLSLTDVDSFGTWSWNPSYGMTTMSGGSCAPQFCNWAAGQPDGGAPGAPEHYILGTTAGTWHDYPAAAGAPVFICEKKGQAEAHYALVSGTYNRGYKYFPHFNIAQSTAATLCSNLGGWLATVNHYYEANAINQLGIVRWSWLGGTLVVATVHWKWTYGPAADQVEFFDGNTMSAIGSQYNNWYPTEPNGVTTEPSLAMVGNDYPTNRWLDIPPSGVNAIHGYTCEFAL